MKNKYIALFVTVSVVIIYFLSTPQNRTSTMPKIAPVLSGKSLDGKIISLSDYKGQVVLVDFWATWCDPCREEIPDLEQIYNTLKSKKFTILGVSMDESGEKAVNKFKAEQKISYPIILNNGQEVPTGWTVPGLPTAYLISKHGKILKRWLGAKDVAELKAEIDVALAQ